MAVGFVGTILKEGILTRIVVNPTPDALPTQLKFLKDGTDLTINNVAGTIFVSGGQSILSKDKVIPSGIYHDGYSLIDIEDIKYIDDSNNIQVANSQLDLISAEQQRGLFEIVQGLEYTILDITQNIILPGNVINIEVPSTPTDGLPDISDRVLITTATPHIPQGIYKVLDKTIVGGVCTLQINYEVNLSTMAPYDTILKPGKLKKYSYYWDEVYTTPLGLYSNVLIQGDISASGDFPTLGDVQIGWFYNVLAIVTDSDVTKTNTGLTFAIGDKIRWTGTSWEILIDYYFGVENGDSNTITVNISDVNIIPKANDIFVIQKVFNENINYIIGSTTDGLNNVPFVFGAETYLFTILTVIKTDNQYILGLDKSIKIDINDSNNPKYMLALLNRGGTTVSKDLYDNLWEFHEIHRQQIIGDPYEFIGVTAPAGRKNYLYYTGSEYLGLRTQLSGFLPSENTPFVVLHFNEEVKDRLSMIEGDIEIHFPGLLLQEEKTPTILINSTIQYSNEVGYYSFLYGKYSGTEIRYGWVFHDLRLVVIDHHEAAIALGYNTNRNYSLPDPILSQPGNLIENSNEGNPLIISGVNIVGFTDEITTEEEHRLVSGDAIIIKGIFPIGFNANTPPDQYYYADPTGPKTFLIYKDAGFITPVNDTNPYISGGICYGNKLPKEYFITYRLIGPNYETLSYAKPISFNFQNNGGIDNVNGNVILNFDSLTHLIGTHLHTPDPDTIVTEGFEATDFQIIIGKFKQDLTNLLEVKSIEEIKIFSSKSLFDGSPTPAQNVNHTSGEIYKLDYDSADDYDLINNQPIYNIPSIPATLFTGVNKWFIGNIIYKQHVKQHRLVFTVTIPANKWNDTTNPSFVSNDILMKEKLISELGFLIKDTLGVAVENPYIYAKFSPVIKKSNGTDLTIQVQIDF